MNSNQRSGKRLNVSNKMNIIILNILWNIKYIKNISQVYHTFKIYYIFSKFQNNMQKIILHFYVLK